MYAQVNDSEEYSRNIREVTLFIEYDVGQIILIERYVS